MFVAHAVKNSEKVLCQQIEHLLDQLVRAYAWLLSILWKVENEEGDIGVLWTNL